MSDIYMDEVLPYESDEKTMRVWPKYEPDLQLNANFAVCDTCGGHGKHSNHLGSFTSSEFYETFGDDRDGGAEDYFSGAYDKVCETCQGKRVVLVVDRVDNEPEDLQKWDKMREELWDIRSERVAEMRAGA